MPNALHDAIVAELRDHKLCHVASIENNRPLNSTVEFASDGTTIFLVSIPETQKVKNLLTNPRVAITMAEPASDPDTIRGVQYFGVAALVTDEARREKIKNRFLDKYLLEPSAHWSRSRSVYYEVTPERIDLIDYSKGYGHKDIWTP